VAFYELGNTFRLHLEPEFFVEFSKLLCLLFIWLTVLW
jgi:hypothetical protein